MFALAKSGLVNACQIGYEGGAAHSADIHQSTNPCFTGSSGAQRVKTTYIEHNRPANVNQVYVGAMLKQILQTI